MIFPDSLYSFSLSSDSTVMTEVSIDLTVISLNKKGQELASNLIS